MTFITPYLKASLWLAISGLLCFIAALMLPSVSLIVLGNSIILSGLQANAWAVGLGIEFVTRAFATHTLIDAKLIILGIAGVLNIVFVITPATLMLSAPRRPMLRWLGGASLVGLMLGVLVPFMLENMHSFVLIGYFVWLLGYGLIFGAVIVALRQLSD